MPTKSFLLLCSQIVTLTCEYNSSQASTVSTFFSNNIPLNSVSVSAEVKEIS